MVANSIALYTEAHNPETIPTNAKGDFKKFTPARDDLLVWMAG